MQKNTFFTNAIRTIGYALLALGAIDIIFFKHSHIPVDSFAGELLPVIAVLMTEYKVDNRSKTSKRKIIEISIWVVLCVILYLFW